MTRTDRQRIAQETMKISRQGSYMYQGKEISLGKNQKEIEDVLVFSPERVDAIARKNEINMASEDCVMITDNCDSFEAVGKHCRDDENVLVMNFANAMHPGGGFLSGASAQEESLCRCSTLYASISSKKAREMYEYNSAHRNPLDSDYMLISPNVCVFRDEKFSLLEKPFYTSVLTIPAPNRCGRASKLVQAELDEAMLDKIRKLLLVASAEGYDVLVLGAWGCGAFGHDAKVVAGYFKEVLLHEQFSKYFSKIVFAVYDKTPDQYNFRSFVKCLGDREMWAYGGCVLFSYDTFPAFGTPDDDRGYKLIIFRDGKLLVLVREAFQQMHQYEKNLPEKRMHQLQEIMNKYQWFIKKMPEHIDNHSCDGVGNFFVFDGRRVTDWNIEDYEGQVSEDNMNYENVAMLETVVINIFRKIAKVLQEEGIVMRLEEIIIDN